MVYAYESFFSKGIERVDFRPEQSVTVSRSKNTGKAICMNTIIDIIVSVYIFTQYKLFKSELARVASNPAAALSRPMYVTAMPY